MSTTTRLLSLLVLATLAGLPGCFFYDFDDDPEVEYRDPEPVNARPFIVAEDTWWTCDLDEDYGYFFEFQALVEDDDGLRDVEYVDVSVFEAGYEDVDLGFFTLNYEGDGIWGGIVWEDESDLWCGDPVDVLFEAWDRDEAYDSLMVRY